jgi:hypothetical protein
MLFNIGNYSEVADESPARKVLRFGWNATIPAAHDLVPILI